jgi:hypothetical protein
MLGSKTVTLLLGLFIALIDGTVSPYFPATVRGHNVLNIMECIAFMIIAWRWIRADNKQSGIKLHTGLFITMIFLPIIGFPYYFFRHFGAADGIIKCCLFIGYIVLVSVCSVIGTFGIIKLFH